MGSLNRLLEEYSTWSSQLEEGFESGVSVGGELSWDFDKVVICGMGGSGAVADFLWAISGIRGLRHIVHPWKDFGVPPWTDPSTLVISVSYSGNTVETINCAQRALSLRARVVAVASGGILASMAKTRGIPLIKVPEGFYPRSSLPYMLGGCMGLLYSAGFLNIAVEEVIQAADVLRKTSSKEAEGVAELIYGSDLVIVSSCGYYSVVANRWKTELSENSKMIAKAESYPESAHNDLVSWQESHGVRASYIVIRPPDEVCGSISGFLEEVYSARGRSLTLRAEGPSPLSSMLRLSLLAGYTSLLVAKKRGVDPGNTDIILEYKRKVMGPLGAGSVNP